ncbi:hypothetical protein P3T76_006050 [Phytophthora citrophthora]|uniref:RxLR effector protein n=1 Tax=Phytophthora citrophthora TaxID=4793 RepID=A0AAD9GQF3_9STRA|nr:hypothetical protein P3T76_006050 [Phytophthora citrophthora]
MRVSTLVLSTLVVLSSSQASKGENPSQSIDNIQSTGRFLRDQAHVDEDRLNVKLSPEAEKWLAGLAGKSTAELEKFAQAPKNVNPEELLKLMKSNAEEYFMSLVKEGVTPKIMREEYRIEGMRKTMSESALLRNVDYQEYVRFKEFWDKLPMTLKIKLFLKRLPNSFLRSKP